MLDCYKHLDIDQSPIVTAARSSEECIIRSLLSVLTASIVGHEVCEHDTAGRGVTPLMRSGCTIHQKAAGEGLGFKLKGENFTISGGHLRHTGPPMSMQQPAGYCACQVHVVS